MNTTHFLFIFFALLNALFFAAARGGLDFISGRSGEARIELYPERIKVIGHTPPPEAAQADVSSAAVAPAVPATPVAQPMSPPACLAWSGLTPAQNNKLISLLSAAGIQAAARDVQVTASWRVVRVPSMLTYEAAEILADNMGELGVEKSTIQIEDTEDNKFLIVLGENRNRRSAERHLEAINAKGINAGIEPRNATERRVEATVSKERAEALLGGQPFAKRYKPCTS
jgi:hypothetical protein